MWLKVVVALAFVLIIGYVVQHQVSNRREMVEVSAANAGQDIGVYARAAASYAELHTSAVGTLTDSQLALPAWYKKQQGLSAVVNAGNAYVYVAPGGKTRPLDVMRNASAPGRQVGIKSGSIAKDATGTAISGQVIPLPSTIPDGSAVFVAREALPPPALPPASPIVAQPPPTAPVYNPVAPPPALPTAPPYVTTPVTIAPPVTPTAPIPPPPPAQPPIPPSPPKISAFTIGVYGGYSSVDGPKPGMKLCKLHNFNTFVLWDASQGNPADSYQITIVRNGLTLNKTLLNKQVQCAVACAGNGSLLTSDEAQGITPEINWSRLVYDHVVRNGPGIEIVPWMMDMQVSLKACNGNGCGETVEYAKSLAIFSNGVHDCGTSGYPDTAHP